MGIYRGFKAVQVFDNLEAARMAIPASGAMAIEVWENGDTSEFVRDPDGVDLEMYDGSRWRRELSGSAAAAIALDADAKATEAQQVQARRDFGKWSLTDYLASYLTPSEYDAVLAGDIDAQNETMNTAALQAMNDDAMDWWRQGNYRTVCTELPRGATLAINDEFFSQQHADYVWRLPHGNNRWVINADDVILYLKNWTGRTAIRTGGFYSENGISYPVERAVFRWERFPQNGVFPRLNGSLTIRSPGSIDHDPVGAKYHNGAEVKVSGLRVVGLRNHHVITEGLFNGYFDGLTLGAGGYQPTEFGGDYGHMSATVRFSNAGAVVVATEPVFSSDHLGRYFGLDGAGPASGSVRLIHWSIIASVDSATQITLSDAPDTNVDGKYGSFEAMRASVAVNGTTWTMSAPLSADMTGPIVTLCGTRAVGKPSERGTLTTRILSHSGDTVEVADAAAVAVTNGLMVFSPLLLVDQVTGQGGGATDNVSFIAPRIESSDGARNSVVQAVFGTYTTGALSDAKLHGSGASGNNFGGSAANCVLGIAEINYSGKLSQSGNSPRWGCITAVGGNIQANFSGHMQGYPFGTHTAAVYCNPITPGARVNIRMGMPVIANGFPMASQTGLRLGPNGTDNMVTTVGSVPRGPNGTLYLTELGRVTAESIETPYHRQYRETVSTGAGAWKLPMDAYTTWVVRGSAVVRDNSGSARKGFTFSGMIGRGQFVGNTAITGTPSVVVVGATSAPDHAVALTADTTIGGLSIDLTGNGTWMVDLTIVEAGV